MDHGALNLLRIIVCRALQVLTGTMRLQLGTRQRRLQAQPFVMQMGRLSQAQQLRTTRGFIDDHTSKKKKKKKKIEKEKSKKKKKQAGRAAGGEQTQGTAAGSLRHSDLNFTRDRTQEPEHSNT
jgi:hypothetical protein